MKKVVLAAIDFSKGSMHAFKYAIRIANKVDANVLLVWVDKLKNSDSVYLDSSSNPRNEAKRRFEELIKKYESKLTGGKFSYKLRSGKVYKEIVTQAKYNDSYIMVVGTHGTSGFEEFWIGSTAYKIVTYSPCPVITIRYGGDSKKTIKKIVLPIDSTRQTCQKVPFIADIAKMHDAEVHVVGLYSSSVKTIRTFVDGYTDQVTKYFDEKEIKYVVKKIDVDNITNSTIDYAKEINADLIAIMTEQEPTAANILLGAYAQQMVNHSPIPVLSIHAKELYDSVK